jgi:A-factor type gamma-butyrolactone 1'-reductase (1S-forming)
MGRFEGKVAVVTGGVSGLGAETARLIAREGGKVVVAGRRAEQGQAVAAGIVAAGGEAIFVRTDVTRPADVEAMVDAAVSRWGRLDIGVNSAGIGGPTQTLIADITEEGWDELIQTNLTAVWRCMKHELRAMAAHGSGAIVNVSSIYGVKASDVSHAPYAAAKHAVIGLTRTAAIDYGDKGIRVNAVCPGLFHSEMSTPYLEIAPKFIADLVARHSAMGRMGETHEIAEAVAWLCSDASSYVNGAALVVDGGETSRIY